jgi:hypothetical protein
MDFAPGPTGSGRVLLDGSVLTVPTEHRHSLATLLSHLELTALRRQRVLASLTIDDQPVRIAESGESEDFSEDWREIKATSISFGNLSRRLIGSATVNLQALRNGVEQAVLEVMINEPKILEPIWSRWHPDVLNTLAVFNLLRQLWHADRFDSWIGPAELQRHCEEIDHLVCDIQLAFLSPAEPDATAVSLALSELFEHRLLPWLDQTNRLLHQLHENIVDD